MAQRSWNINVGVLGHVDSGKTALCRALSVVGSTAAFDKNPQSQERGITLDLGFSAFPVAIDPASAQGDAAAAHAAFAAAGATNVQFTLVDCPGHASLIRTVIGGAQIIDVMVLVIDATRGIQTQTAECIVLGELLGRRLIVALNKVDMVRGATPEDKAASLKKIKAKLRAVFAKTRWPDAPMLEVAAAPGADSTAPPVGLPAFVDAVVAAASRTPMVRRRAAGEAEPEGQGEFLMLVDHCFAVKGQGTVLTGTVLRGSVAVGDDVFFPAQRASKRVKGVQVFRKPVPRAVRGDRVGVCVAHFDAGAMERGIVCSPVADTAVSAARPPSAVAELRSAVARVHRVRFYKGEVEAGAKFHFTLGHDTVMGTMRFFSAATPGALAATGAADGAPFDATAEYAIEEGLPASSSPVFDTARRDAADPEQALPCAEDSVAYYAVVLLEAPVLAYPGATLIASRLDVDTHSPTCRLAVQGTLLTGDLRHVAMPAAPGEAKDEEPWRRLRVVRQKLKVTLVDRVVSPTDCVTRSLLAASAAGSGGSTDVAKFKGAKVELHELPQGVTDLPDGSTAIATGIVEGAFGSSGKAKVTFRESVLDKAKKYAVTIAYKKYPFATAHHFSQT